MEKEKNKIRRLIVLSAEHYEKLRKNFQQGSLPLTQNLSNIEELLLKIINNSKLTPLQKLSAFQNVLTIKQNAQASKIDRNTQTNPRFDDTFKSALESSFDLGPIAASSPLTDEDFNATNVNPIEAMKKVIGSFGSAASTAIAQSLTPKVHTPLSPAFSTPLKTPGSRRKQSTVKRIQSSNPMGLSSTQKKARKIAKARKIIPMDLPTINISDDPVTEAPPVQPKPVGYFATLLKPSLLTTKVWKNYEDETVAKQSSSKKKNLNK